MKITFFLWVAIVVFFCGTPCYAQNGLYDTVAKDIKKIQEGSDYPQITISPAGPYMNYTSIKISDSFYLIEDWYYLIYRQKGKNYLVKYIKAHTGANGKEIYKSRPVPFENDTIFDWVRLYKKEISEENVLPFIYRDTTSPITSYKEGLIFHTTSFQIVVHHREETPGILSVIPGFLFDEIAMRSLLIENVRGLPKNLNYEHNSHLKIFQVYLLFTTLMADSDAYPSKINLEFE